jgi:histidinol-phosphate aminotransferase
MSLTPRPGVLDIQPYVPGASSLAGHGAAMKLSANEGALGPSPNAVVAYREATALERYPDGDATALREAIGRCHGLDPARIVVGAGSDEILFNLARGYAGVGDEVIFSAHGFNMYPIIAHSIGAAAVTAAEPELVFDVGNALDKVTDRTRVVFIANPNNPTGTYIPADEVRRLREGLPDGVLLVIDAAYAEFVTREDYSPGIELVDAGANTVMTRTFSKIYALAALRLGWAYCPPAVADVLNRLRAPFNVATPAQLAGVAAVEDTGHVKAAREHNETWHGWLSARIAEAGLVTTPSVANFVLVRFAGDPARGADAAMGFLNSRGIIARGTAGYGLADCLRITIGTEDEMRATAQAIAGFVAGEAVSGRRDGEAA